MDRPLISVIVPVYNVESYLPQCIDSILAQTYENLEIILVDDGSTDSSGRICEDYAGRDPRIKTIHKPNEGLADARNRGIQAARGVYCSFVDSDDHIAGDCIAYLYDMADTYGAQIAVCGYQKVHNNDLVRASDPDGTNKAVSVYDTFNALSALLYQRGIITAAWGRLFRRELFNAIRFPKGRQHEDVAVMYRLFDQAETIAVGYERKYYYLQRPGSIVHSAFDGKRMDYIAFTRECIEYMQGRHPALVSAAVSRHFSACFELLAGMPPAITSGSGRRDPADGKEDQDRERMCGEAYQKLVQEIKRYRKTVLCDRSARPANRIAAMGSYVSIRAIQRLSRLKRIDQPNRGVIFSAPRVHTHKTDGKEMSYKELRWNRVER